MNEPDTPFTPPPPPPASAGRLLSSARHKWELSVQDVAACLNLSSATITALEADAYEQLPGSTFVKGYLRSYAKLLELDPEEIMACVNIEPEGLREIPSAPMSLKPTGRSYARRNKPGLFWRVLLVVGVLAGLVWVGLSQLPSPDTNKIFEMFELPALVDEQPGAESSSATQTPPPDGSDSDKGALIRTE